MENKEYMDREIFKHVQIILTMMMGEITTDHALKTFLYELALLNSMAHKCYMTRDLYECRERYFSLVRDDFSDLERDLLFFPESLGSYYDWTITAKTRVSRIAEAIKKEL